VKQNRRTRTANQLAASASEVAVKGGRVVSEVVARCLDQRIVEQDRGHHQRDRRHRFQTNILALNAAVEARARRAGRASRGGERSAQTRATERARGEGDQGADRDSVDKVGAGTKLVDEPGRRCRRCGFVKRVTTS